MTVVYADVVFLINTLVDYLVLLLTGRLAGIPLRRKRFFAAALIGGLYGVAAVVPMVECVTLGPAKLLVWLVMILCAYGYSQQFLKLTLLFGMVCCALAGVVLGLGLFFRRYRMAGVLPKDCGVLILCGLCVCGVCSVLFRTCIHSNVQGMRIPVEVSVAGKRLTLTALLDTGNQLRDSITGQPILVVAPQALQSVLPQSLRQRLSPERLREPSGICQELQAAAPTLCPGLVAYRTIGISDGALLTLQTDWVQIGNTVYRHARVAIAPFELGLGYSALWGGTWKGESNAHDILGKTPAVAQSATEP